MQINEETMTAIAKFKQRGDITAISEAAKVSTIYVSRTFRLKKGSPKVVNAIVEHYNKVIPQRKKQRAAAEKLASHE